jgi:hypothetical protein
MKQWHKGGLNTCRRYRSVTESVVNNTEGAGQMNATKKGSFTEQVRRFRARFVRSVGLSLGQVISAHLLSAAVRETCGSWRERLYGPLTTVALFVEQVLGAAHSCQSAVAQGLSARGDLGQAHCSLNTGPYCKARKRLALWPRRTAGA